MDILLDKKRIYLDYNATTPPAQILNQKIQEYLSIWGNPSSVHQDGQKARFFLWNSKIHLAKFMGCAPLELIATSGGSEANNMAITGLYEKHFLKNPQRNEIILSSTEHPSVIKPIERLKKKGLKIKYIPVSATGELDILAYDSLLSEKTFMVCIMYANNETGNIFPIPELVKKAHKVGALFHCDAVQALGKIPVNLHQWKVDTASFSAHKVYALKGTGVLYCRSGLSPASLILGGSQERNRRAGTQNLLGMICFGLIAQKGEEILNKMKQINILRDQLEQKILSSTDSIKILGSLKNRLGNTSCMSFLNIDGETLLINMDLKGYSFSVGSACHSGSINSSSVMMAMGLNEAQARCVIRISLGLGVTSKNIDCFASDLISSVRRIRSLSFKVKE